MTRATIILDKPEDFRYEISKQPDTSFYADEYPLGYNLRMPLDFNLYFNGIESYTTCREVSKVISEGIDRVHIELFSKNNKRTLCGTHYDTITIDDITDAYRKSLRAQGYLPAGFSEKYPLFPEAKNDKIRAIRKIIHNGPATIIIDIYGDKTITKFQGDENKKYQNRILGFYMCLIKYLIDDNKIYHDIVYDIFEYYRYSDRNMIARSIIKSHIGLDDTCMVRHWIDEEKENSCQKKYPNPWKLKPTK